MAGVTDHPFRVLCRRFGVGVVYTEFVSANGIIRGGAKTLRMVRFTPNERPIGIQVFGDTPEVIAASVAYLAKKHQPDLIDLNFGCPVPKIVKKGAGSAMLRDLALMREVVTATVAAADSIARGTGPSESRPGPNFNAAIAISSAATIAILLGRLSNSRSQGFSAGLRQRGIAPSTWGAPLRSVARSPTCNLVRLPTCVEHLTPRTTRLTRISYESARQNLWVVPGGSPEGLRSELCAPLPIVCACLGVSSYCH